MYAIFRTGGKQYKVKAGDLVKIEKIENELGAEVEMKDILLISGDKTFVGAPTVANATVLAVVTKQAKAPKVIVFKKKRRQGYRKMQGHRQLYTEIFIKAITSPEGDVSTAEGKAPVVDPKKREERLAAAAAEKQTDKEAGVKKAAAPKKAKKKTVAKKAAAGKKKAGAKKKVAAKKKTAAKKTAKKKTVAKKATKKK